MTVLWTESFDLVGETHLASKWSNYSNGGGSIGTGSGRTNKGLALRSSAGYLAQTFSVQSTLVLGYWVRINTFVTSPFSTATRMAGVWDGGTLQCWLGHDEVTGVLKLFRGVDETNLLATSSNAIAAGTGYYIEFLCTPHSASGTCTVRVNGDIWASVSGVNTRASGANQATIARFGWQGEALPPTDSNQDWDDLYVGTAFLGDSVIEVLLPSGAGNSTQFTPAGAASNWDCCNDAPADDDTTTVSSSTVGHRDLYTLANLAETDPITVHAVMTHARAKKSDAGTRSLATVVRSGSTNAVGTTTALSTSYAYYTTVHNTDPATSVAWTASGANGLEAGHEIAL